MNICLKIVQPSGYEFDFDFEFDASKLNTWLSPLEIEVAWSGGKIAQ